MEAELFSESHDFSASCLTQISPALTPSLQQPPSCSHNKKIKTRKPSTSNNIKELKDEDDIFFNDDTHLPDVSENSGSEHGEPLQADQLLAAHRRKLIRDLLASFDLEKVMDRYRGDSVRKSLSKRKYRKWLSSAMSVEQANFSDRQWNEQFRQQVFEEFERKQDERERKLADAESQRILKLKLQGILRDEEAEARREEMAMRKTAAERKFEHRSTKKHHSLFKPNDIETQMEILNRNERESRRKITGNEDDDSLDGNPDASSGDVDISGLPTYKSQLGRMKSDTEEVHPQLRDLYEEEDLSRLYSEAENLVRRPRVK
ncbi:unnamed protein product [Candidula unifasciata]|uniref:Uncharacterized protein n=1 Tax=Candidula unifasciata TaxID=100452 RepID=A0A8S3YZ90_9EUPU|nr:unnamed protein product [Candidula unifasciata]